MLTEDYLRLSIFIAVLVLMAMLEVVIPKRQRKQARRQRWLTHFLLTIINTLTLKLLGPLAAIGVADYALDNHWGLFSLSPIPLPFWFELLAGIILLDFAIYLQHLASHRIPLLWRFHKMHHSDIDIDVTTAIRFHPIEVVASMLYKCLVIILLGPITLAVIIFEILLNASAMFNHANIHLPYRLDRILRMVLVTPDVHRVHHSVHHHETDSNYGFCLSVWDRLFNTYITQPRDGHETMKIGLNFYQNNNPQRLFWCLLLPFKTAKRENKVYEY